jgi:integrase
LDFVASPGKCRVADETFPTITPCDLRHTASCIAVCAHANIEPVQRMLGDAKASMTLDTHADLGDEDLDGVADRLEAIHAAADPMRLASEAEFRASTRPAQTLWS